LVLGGICWGAPWIIDRYNEKLTKKEDLMKKIINNDASPEEGEEYLRLIDIVCVSLSEGAYGEYEHNKKI
jgi:hypothetical protein